MTTRFGIQAPREDLVTYSECGPKPARRALSARLAE